MFKKLIPFMEKPALNTLGISSLYRALWDDEHISKGMLKSHLNPDEEGATSKHAYVFASAQWIARTAPPPQYNALLDLGCGPGIYAERFAKEGYCVTGVDYSKRSIEYAIEQSKRNGSSIEYLYQDYLTIDYAEQFDIVTLINKDYAVFSIADRMTLLKKVHQALKPGGTFIFDVLTTKMRKKEYRSWQYCENGGFFNEKPHLLFEAAYQYDDDDRTEIHQYIVATEENVQCYICPNHYFTRASLLSELAPIGFSRIEFYGDVAGKAYYDTGETICCVVIK